MTNLILVIGNKNYSSWSLRPWLLMKQWGLDFDEVCIALYTPASRTAIRQYSPSGKVPVLIHDTVTVWDSLAICEYLTEQFPMFHGWPKDITTKAIARSISAEMHSSFQALRQNMPMNCRARLSGKGITDDVQGDTDRVTAIWRKCRQQFNRNGKFLFGEFTIADAMFAPMILRFITYDVPLDSISRNYAEAILALSTIQEWIEAAKTEPETIPSFELV